MEVRRVLLIWDDIGKAVLMEWYVFSDWYMGRREVDRGEGGIWSHKEMLS